MSVRVFTKTIVCFSLLVFCCAFCYALEKKEPLQHSLLIPTGNIQIVYRGEKASPRINYAIEQVRGACNEMSVSGLVQVSRQNSDGSDKLKPEGYSLKSIGVGSVEVIGADQSGVLYGCLELAERIRAAKAMPVKLDLTDAPEFKLRGPAIGMQKLGGAYLHPYTPETFPFFYDKTHWLEYLDFLVSIRMNSLYLWNGHPFASLVELDDYPEALEVSPEILEKNRETMYWLTSECDKRGIWLIQMFYNIHLPESLGLGTGLKRSEPKAADYTRKSIAKFVEEYPNVGLLVCLGEALSGKEAQVEWFTETIIPGMKDGLKARGQTELPPIVVRGHHIVEHGSHKDVLSEGLKLYPNLFSMVKYNGESLTSETPRGKYQQYHKDMAKYSGTHMANVHLLSNLEPFRYADFSFIWNCCKAIRDRLDGNGLHLYPLNYWDWPNTPDTAGITQWKRDRLWFEIWARYCWKLDRDPADEQEYWTGHLADIYGTRRAAEKIYAAYDAYGECAPRILRRFGITGGNRQCMNLGMFLEQLTDPKTARVWRELYDSDSPPGETITQYINNEYANKPHVGETPPQIIKEVLDFSAEAVQQIEAAAQYVTNNKEEFERLRNDVLCVDAMCKSYCAKVQAAMMVHRYHHSDDVVYMKKALPLLEESLVHYKILVELAGDVYRYSNGFHGSQKVPKSGVHHWIQIVGDYEKELADFRKKIAALNGKEPTKTVINKTDVRQWPAAEFKLLTPGMETYKVKKGAKVFTDRNYTINDIAPQLVGLTGIRFSHSKASKGGILKIDFELTDPVKVLVGYFDSDEKEWCQVPALEHVTHADDRGGIDAVLEDVAEIGDVNMKLPKVNLHAFRYETGKNTLEMIGQGSYVILGVIPAEKKKLVVLSEHMGPMIGPDHPDVKKSGNRSGFETGQLIKHKGVYHMFVNEMFGDHHIDMRVSHWSSPDAVNWKRQSTIVDSIPGRSHTNLRSEVWLTGVEFNEDEYCWNIFYVAYRGGDGEKGEGARWDYAGRIWRARSKVKGTDGIAGPYEDVEIILQPDDNTQKWEGHQAVDSFNPYKVGNKWYAFYGGHSHHPVGPWLIGLAVADKLSGPWKRMPEGFNPVPLVEKFVENPVVSRLPDGRWMAVFDSDGGREIGYSFSKDGITWPPETRIVVPTDDNIWTNGVRTPLCAVREDDGTFTVFYTARMKDQPFWGVGKCTLGWASDQNASISQKQVIDACRKAADWQLKAPQICPIGSWVYGPFINGLFAISQIPGNERYLDEAIKIGEKENWQVISTVTPANDHCTPQAWLDIYRLKKEPQMLEPTRKALDEYIATSESLDDSLDYGTKANWKKWSWCDALFMSPPTFARMYRLTGDEKYRNYLHTWWWKVSDYYYDTDEHLYYRDEKFFEQREPNGKKVFWSRGNGWVVGGLARVLQVLEKDDPMRPKYIQQLQEMCNKLAAIQSDDGLWRSGLLDPVAHPQPETSGSAFYVYAMAYAVNEGIIDRDRFVPVIEKAWAGLCRYLQEDGCFGGIQPIGEGPKKYDSKNSMPYGVGAFMLAGSEVHRMLEE